MVKFQFSTKAAAAPSDRHKHSSVLGARRTHGQMTERATSFDIMDDIHDSGYLFYGRRRQRCHSRNCIGAGTRAQGHTESSTGTNMLTLVTDQTFEFRLQLAQVSKMVLLEK
jgi:hypothetical protein